MINTYKILVGKSEGKRPLGRSRPIRKNNIKKVFRGTEFEDVDQIYVVQD
jgi:hypothetical protein